MTQKATVIAVVNQKGGTGKTTTCENLGIGLAMEGKKILLVDADPQANLTINMGWPKPDELETTLSSLMGKVLEDKSIQPGEGILHHAEGVDLIPSSIELAGMEVGLVNAMSREKVLKQVLDVNKRSYDFILLDCTPSLGMLTIVSTLLWPDVRALRGLVCMSCGYQAINALAAADSALIPVQAQYLPVKGLEQLLQTISKVRQQINPRLRIEGILMTMTDSRTRFGKEIDALVRQVYDGKIKVFSRETHV